MQFTTLPFFTHSLTYHTDEKDRLTNELKASELVHARVVDCPGYGFARASSVEKERWRRFMELYLKQA